MSLDKSRLKTNWHKQVRFFFTLVLMVCSGEILCEDPTDYEKIADSLFSLNWKAPEVVRFAKDCELIPPPTILNTNKVSIAAQHSVASQLVSVGEAELAVPIFRLLSRQKTDIFVQMDSVRQLLDTQHDGLKAYKMFSEEFALAMQVADSLPFDSEAGNMMLANMLYKKAAAIELQSGNSKESAKFIEKALSREAALPRFEIHELAESTNTVVNGAPRESSGLLIQLASSFAASGNCDKLTQTLGRIENEEVPCEKMVAYNVLLNDPSAQCVHERILDKIYESVRDKSCPACPDTLATIGVVVQQFADRKDIRALTLSRFVAENQSYEKTFGESYYKWKISNKQFASQMFLTAFKMTENQNNMLLLETVGKEFLDAFPGDPMSKMVLESITLSKAVSQGKRVVSVGFLCFTIILLVGVYATTKLRMNQRTEVKSVNLNGINDN